MNTKDVELFGNSYVTGLSSDVMNIKHFLGYSIHFTYDDITPVAGAFTANVTDICTKATHGMLTGLKVRVSSTVTLPDGLLANTDYFVISGGVDTFALSDSLAHALAGTDIINIGDAGTGVHTITPTPLAGCSATIQYSNNGVNWDDVASGSVNIAADGNKMFNLSNCYYSYVKAVFAITAGQVTLSGKFFSKGD